MLGRIYKIEGGGKFYIGSTTCELKYRLKKHRSKSKEIVAKNTPLYVHFREIGWQNANITQIEQFEITSRKDLLIRECEYIKNFLDNENCLNRKRPVITKEEKKLSDKIYGRKIRKENPEKERQRLKEWRKNNPEKWKEQYTKYIQKKKELQLKKLSE